MNHFSMIVAVDEMWGMGINNQLLCHIPDDLKRFKKLTTGHTVIMGRLTFESLPKGALPNRRNIVLTQNRNLQYAGCEMAHSIDEVKAMVANEKEVFIIGGAQIYTCFLPLTDKIYLTQIHAQLNADTYFPALNQQEWNITQTLCMENKEIPYSFIDLERL